MSNLTIPQLESYDVAAGWATANIPTAAAVEEAESSGNPNAIGPGGSWGTFQIQPQYHTNMPQTTNPLTQAQDALSIFKSAGNSFAPWSTFNNNAYQQWLSTATADMSQVNANDATTLTSNSTGNTNPLNTLASLFNITGGSYSDMLTQIGLMLMGLALVCIGVYLTFSKQIEGITSKL